MNSKNDGNEGCTNSLPQMSNGDITLFLSYFKKSRKKKIRFTRLMCKKGSQYTTVRKTRNFIFSIKFFLKRVSTTYRPPIFTTAFTRLYLFKLANPYFRTTFMCTALSIKEFHTHYKKKGKDSDRERKTLL